MTISSDARIAVVTGASSGIGEATARTLAAQGFHVVIGARRVDRLEKIAEEIGGTALELDVTDEDSVDAFAAVVPRVDVLVNNAGGAKGLATVLDADLDDWRWMWETNVMGTLRVTKALLPKLIDSGDGLVVTITSVAALEAYDNGSGYTTAKHAQAVLHRTLRGELLGKPVRLTEIAPGAVETEFSLVRFEGDQDKADKVYEGITPLVAQDIAEIIGFVASRPSHVNPRSDHRQAEGSGKPRSVPPHHQLVRIVLTNQCESPGAGRGRDCVQSRPPSFPWKRYGHLRFHQR